MYLAKCYFSSFVFWAPHSNFIFRVILFPMFSSTFCQNHYATYLWSSAPPACQGVGLVPPPGFRSVGFPGLPLCWISDSWFSDRCSILRAFLGLFGWLVRPNRHPLFLVRCSPWPGLVPASGWVPLVRSGWAGVGVGLVWLGFPSLGSWSVWSN